MYTGYREKKDSFLISILVLVYIWLHKLFMSLSHGFFNITQNIDDKDSISNCINSTEINMQVYCSWIENIRS